MELDLDFFAIAGFIISIPFLLIMRSIYKEDSSVESTFFTIDTSRTLRFVFGYLILLEMGVLGFTFVFSYLLMGLMLIVGIVFVFAYNVLLLIIFLIGMLLTLGGGGSYEPSGFEVFEYIMNSLFPWVIIDVIFDPGFVVAILVLYIICPIVSGYQLGKYVESRKSATLTELSWHMILLNITLLLEFFNPMETFQGAYIGLFVFHWLLSSIAINRAFKWKDIVKEYNLPDIIQYKKLMALIFGYIGSFIVGSLYFAFFDAVIFDKLDNPILSAQQILFVAPSIMTATFGFMFFLRGDHPLEIRIDEIDMREELLEMAREFRELDPSKMDEYMRKGNQQIRYI